MALVLVILSFTFSSQLLAQQKPEEPKIAFHPADTLQVILERHKGKSVTLKLDSGHEVGGIVREVGSQLVYLSQLVGKEFFDALIRIDRISAVIIRVKTR